MGPCDGIFIAFGQHQQEPQIHQQLAHLGEFGHLNGVADGYQDDFNIVPRLTQSPFQRAQRPAVDDLGVRPVTV